MSVDLRLYVGRYNGPPGAWLKPFATLEMLGWPYRSKLMSRKVLETSPEVFLYASDGETRITKDAYGKILRAEPLDLIIEFLDADCGRELHWTLACLLEMQRFQQVHALDWDLRVVRYFY